MRIWAMYLYIYCTEIIRSVHFIHFIQNIENDCETFHTLAIGNAI